MGQNFGNYTAIEQFLITLAIVMPRLTAAFMVIPFLSRKVFTGIVIRNGFYVSLAIILVPMHYNQLQGLENISIPMGISILFKEIFLGMIIGYMVSIPFWAVESVGFFIDNQRGATLASTLNPLSGDQTSPTGILLEQAVAVIFFASGAILALLGMLYQSYVEWPIIDLSMSLDLNKAFFFLEQLDFLMMITMILAGPIVLGMFISEFSFALINRFTPSLNVFILSMPVKSAVSLILMVFYIDGFFYYLQENTDSIEEIFKTIGEVLYNK